MLNTKQLTGKLLLKDGQVYLPNSSKIEKRDLLLENGILKGMEKSIEVSDGMEVMDCSDRIISPGFTDIHVHFREPGQENKETLKSGTEAAVAGGFTTVCCMPNTEPPIDTQESVRFIRQRQEELLAEIYPVAAATKGRKGKELTEYGEIAAAGAVGFSDDGAPIATGQVMRKALEYAKIVDKPVIQHAEDLSLKADGLMHESKVSTALGLPGAPAISETTMVYRDIQIAEYVGARLHIQHVSTAGAVELIRAAKERGVKVTAEVTPHHLMLTDEAVRTFDTSTKVNPPLRSRKDVDALRKGVADGTIDAIATDHAPHAIEEKEQTFDLAPPGMIGLESALGVVVKALVDSKITDLQTVLERLVVSPRQVMQLPLDFYTLDNSANLTILNPEEEWVFRREHVHSRSANSPFYGSQLEGRVKAVIHRSQLITSE
ncbi:MAG: dihydroorotase [Candidatus Marinimicrobia bacterium]|nr:dihydroorotase [Candidatus Neomarinimicrobiota bacterium]MCF7827537.1 dihydroorotase [Candidatus Neomarinimicrobiota bacterium]MCF7881601.1 dihydroorotase [Candidatus Neomarinimicrobiota bacterium]